jgi:hypothetical protein
MSVLCAPPVFNRHEGVGRAAAVGQSRHQASRKALAGPREHAQERARSAAEREIREEHGLGRKAVASAAALPTASRD